MSGDTTTPDPPQANEARKDRYQPGALISEKYLLHAPLGEGGMGTVWLAQNTVLQSQVAIKLIHASLHCDEIAARFLLEARVEARFTHPNIVRVLDFGKTELGDPYIVMELLDGITLGDLIEQRGKLAPVEAVQMILPIVDALCHAHDKGVVHRDLKPDNILLHREERATRPKLLDFGVAKQMDAAPERPPTQDGALVGSPAYMAPEQAQCSERVDHRVDVWAICVVLHEAISGKRAFPGEGYVALRAVMESSVPPLEETGAGERELSRVLGRGLRKDPALRFQTMRELGAALAQWLHERGVREDLDGTRLSRTWPIVVKPAPIDPLAPAPRPRARARPMLIAAIVLGTIAVPANTSFTLSPRPQRYVADKAQVLITRLLASINTGEPARKGAEY
jgi:serine/threonine-protein kinase